MACQYFISSLIPLIITSPLRRVNFSSVHYYLPLRRVNFTAGRRSKVDGSEAAENARPSHFSNSLKVIQGQRSEGQCAMCPRCHLSRYWNIDPLWTTSCYNLWGDLNFYPLDYPFSYPHPNFHFLQLLALSDIKFPPYPHTISSKPAFHNYTPPFRPEKIFHFVYKHFLKIVLFQRYHKNSQPVLDATDMKGLSRKPTISTTHLLFIPLFRYWYPWPKQKSGSQINER